MSLLNRSLARGLLWISVSHSLAVGLVPAPPPQAGRRLSDASIRSLPLLLRSYSNSSPEGPSSNSSPLWRLGRLNHVAIAVPDLKKATSLYQDVLGAEVSEVQVRRR